MINLKKEHLYIVKEILQKIIPNYEVWVFGSRATADVKPHSDLDLVIIAEKKLAADKFMALKEAVEESDLPFRVDIIEWVKLTQEFREIILKNYEVIQP